MPRRVGALLGLVPAVRRWSSVFTAVGLAAWTDAAGTAFSVLSSANAAVTLFLVLKAATPLWSGAECVGRPVGGRAAGAGRVRWVSGGP